MGQKHSEQERQFCLPDTRKYLFDQTLEGYCMVFKRKTKHYELKVVPDKTSNNRQILKLTNLTEKNVLKDYPNMNIDDLLITLHHDIRRNKEKTLNDVHISYPIEYRIIESSKQSQYIYVIISCQEEVIEKWAEERDFDVPIDPKQAIINAKKYCKYFLLAKRTYIATPKSKPDPNNYINGEQDDQYKKDMEEYENALEKRPDPNDLDTYKNGENDDLYKRDMSNYEFIVADNEKYRTGRNEPTYQGDELNLPEGQGLINSEESELLIPWYEWDNIHIGYESDLHTRDLNIFKPTCNTRKKHREEHLIPSVISHALYLRILYDILNQDIELNGASFMIEKMLIDTDHPLVQFLTLHQEEIKLTADTTFQKFKCVAFRWSSRGANTEFLDSVRNYYGEHIAFYFAFLIHYTVWLYPLAVCSAIWWIIECAAYDIGSVGCIFVLLVVIIWTILMIEHWYRREWKLRFRWGMMRYRHIEIPRPEFNGRYVISSVNGLRVEKYAQKWLHWFKRIISIFISFICVLLVVAVTAFIWSWQNEYRNADEENDMNYYISVAIGMINSAQILLFNRIYTQLAVFLNEWEGHRLQEEYYNQLVIKRISFIVINSFYSLFYIGFVDNIYPDNKTRLEALRMQLVILFLMSIIYQNTLEIFFPVCCPKIMRCCSRCCCCCCQREENTEQEMEEQIKELLAYDDESRSLSIVQDDDDIKHRDDDDNYYHDEQQYELLQERNIKDIIEQSKLSPSPDVLDNTAEVIVLHGYVTLFIVVFPLMPFLGVINNFVELFVDKYNLRKTQRPVPIAAAGLGVWSTVLAVFAVISIYSNLAILTFNTEIVIDFLILCEEFFADIERVYWTNEDIKENQMTFYFISTTFCVFIVIGIRMCIPNLSNTTADDIARQEICQRELLHIPKEKQENNNNNN